MRHFGWELQLPVVHWGFVQGLGLGGRAAAVVVEVAHRQGLVEVMAAADKRPVDMGLEGTRLVQ